MSEFTGERVIPGLVDANLLNEHIARYRFAARFARAGAAILDAGCGAGYGAAEFAPSLSVTATDLSADALHHARANFSRPHVRFLQAACEALPFAGASFDLVAAFEVIEHIERWPELLNEAKRVLKPSGVLLVSTPNKAYYAEARGAAGPNPFHSHEFEYQEFQAALYAVFPHVRLWTQNHAESIVFAPVNPARAEIEATGDPTPEHAHFFLAACSQTEIEANEVYAWIPSTANVLREREHHIAKLEGELAQKDAWLNEAKSSLAALHGAHEAILEELKQRTQWAARLVAQLKDGDARIAELQNEAEIRLGWVNRLESQIEAGRREIDRLNEHRRQLEADLAARARWGESLNAELEARSQQLAACTRDLDHRTALLEQLRAERRLIADSKWIRLGRRLNLGPAVGRD